MQSCCTLVCMSLCMYVSCITILGSSISPTDNVRDLRVTIDPSLSMKTHILKLCRSCFYQFRQLLRRMHRCFPNEAAQELVHAFVTCQLDYCNSVFFSLSSYPHRITFKICLITYYYLHDLAPDFFKSWCILVSIIPGRANLRSASQGLLQVHTKTKNFGDRSFRSCGPHQRNLLPPN